MKLYALLWSGLFCVLLSSAQDQVFILDANELRVAQAFAQLHSESTTVKIDTTGRNLIFFWSPASEIRTWTLQTEGKSPENRKKELELALQQTDPSRSEPYKTRAFNTILSKLEKSIYHSFALMPPGVISHDKDQGLRKYCLYMCTQKYESAVFHKYEYYKLHNYTIYEHGLYAYLCSNLRDITHVKKIFWMTPYHILCLHDNQQLSWIKIEQENLIMRNHNITNFLPQTHRLVDMAQHPTISTSFYFIFQNNKAITLRQKLTHLLSKPKKISYIPYASIERCENMHDYWQMLTAKSIIKQSSQPFIRADKSLIITPHDAEGSSVITNPLFTATTENIEQLLESSCSLSLQDGLRRLCESDIKINADMQKYRIKPHNRQKFYDNHPARKYFILRWLAAELCK